MIILRNLIFFGFSYAANFSFSLFHHSSSAACHFHMIEALLFFLLQQNTARCWRLTNSLNGLEEEKKQHYKRAETIEKESEVWNSRMGSREIWEKISHNNFHVIISDALWSCFVSSSRRVDGILNSLDTQQSWRVAVELGDSSQTTAHKNERKMKNFRERLENNLQIDERMLCARESDKIQNTFLRQMIIKMRNFHRSRDVA